MPESGDVIITGIKFTDGEDSKIRSALLEEMGNLGIPCVKRSRTYDHGIH
ncbi:MAG: hypothetical protein AMDU5_GPLC00004G0378 [Thermoplasmatales archaeon Gpl]|nr:MAG: hypothetical protein AMDU5_GPLC00004G0378 [Thermoplasmatales archaeon Gpl]